MGQGSLADARRLACFLGGELLHQLVEEYQYRLVRYLIYLTGRRDYVDDIVQETWLRVVERGSSYDGRLRFEPWLFSIARNLTIDQMRKRKAVSLDTAEEDAQFQLPPSGEPSPFEMAARTEDAQRMAQSLQTLEPIYREALRASREPCPPGSASRATRLR